MKSGKSGVLKGKAKKALGRFTGDEHLQRAGKYDQTKGRNRQAREKLAGAARDLKRALTGR
jgi:uncharacterized protein YjbJ (UPF0337 family)